MSPDPKHSLALEKLALARRAWQEAARPNDEREGFDFEAMDALVEASEAFERLDPPTLAEACGDVLSRFFPPKLTDSELDYTWLCVYWRASEFRSCLLDLKATLSAFEVGKTGDQYVSVERYHQEMENIRHLMSEVSSELRIIRQASERSGATIGAFGVSIPIEEIRETLNRIRKQIDGESGLLNLTRVVDLTGSLYKSTKHFFRLIQTSPKSALSSVFANSKAMVKSAGEALMVSLKIKKEETKLPKMEVRIALSGTIPMDDRTARSDMYDISTRIESIVTEYSSKLLDGRFFYRIEAEFGKFEYLVSVNDDLSRLSLARQSSFSETDPSDNVRFAHRRNSYAFTMNYREFASYLIHFIRDVAAVAESKSNVTIDLSKYGAILQVRKNTEGQGDFFVD